MNSIRTGFKIIFDEFKDLLIMNTVPKHFDQRWVEFLVILIAFTSFRGDATGYDHVTSFQLSPSGGVCGRWAVTVTEPSGATVSFDDPANVVINGFTVQTPSGSTITR